MELLEESQFRARQRKDKSKIGIYEWKDENN